uniref:DM2 domain-containing protein n=1 Tax=viral metagenome TaxID=1070528 RepID=A0A6C0JHC7_9ZZZZ
MSTTNKKHLAEHDFIGEVDKQFRSLEQTLSTFRSQITALQSQMRAVEKNTKREMKILKKLADKNRNKGNRKPSGFATPSKISSELCEFMGRESGTQVARTEVTQFVIGYIKQHNLGQSKEIKPDEKLQQLLGSTDEDTVTYFNLQKYMNRHFPSKNKKAKNVVVQASK